MSVFRHTLSIRALSMALILSGCASQDQKNPTDAAAQVRLGNKYSKESWFTPKNDETAASWYRKAALQGDAEGEYHLGVCYDWGLGVPKNNLLAVEWYTKAAQGGNEAAQYELGRCYRLAEGVKLDLVKAYLWFNLSAASGNANAREARDAVAHRMTPDEIRQAESMSRREWERCQ
jgi:TPR repeat protein